MATINGNLITLDGIFSDWAANDMIMTAANAVLNYQVYGAFVANATVTNTNSTPDNTYVIGIDATDPSDPVIGAGTIIYLNTDQNNTTGFSPFGGVNTVGAEYEVQFAIDTNTSDSTFNTLQAYLYSVTPGGVPTLVSTTPLASNINGGSVELAIPQSLLTPDGGTPPTTLDFAALISSQGLPAPFSASTPEYIIPDTAAAPAPTTIANTITLDGTFGDWPAAPPAPGTVGVIVPAYFNPATDPSDWPR
jgi:serralysin